MQSFFRGFDAIRDSRIALQDRFSGDSLIMFGIRDSQRVLSQENCARAASAIISRKEKRRLNYRSRSEHCKSGSKIEVRSAALREPQSKKAFAFRRPTSLLVESVAIRESRIAS